MGDFFGPTALLDMNTCLITGGCGFIGSHIAEALVNEGCAVRVFDNLSSGHEQNIAPVRDKVDFIKADIRNMEALQQAVRGIDCIFHQAALVSVFDSIKRPLANNDINISGTLNVLKAAKDAGVRRVVAASSAAVYGNDPRLPKQESMKPQPESPYAIAKITGEYYLKAFYKLYGLETVSLRYFNVFGPRQDPSSMYSGVISKFTDVLNEGKNPVIYGDGRQTRDFIFVKDVARANLLAMRSDKAGHGEILNVATGNRTSLLALLAVLGELYGMKIQPEFKEARAGDIKNSAADISLARDVLGFSQGFSLREGLEVLTT